VPGILLSGNNYSILYVASNYKINQQRNSVLKSINAARQTSKISILLFKKQRYVFYILSKCLWEAFFYSYINLVVTYSIEIHHSL